MTWNLLHISHEEKYNPNSEVISKYPDENIRIKYLINMIRQLLVNKNKILCLQEVNGDLLSYIKKEFSMNYHIFFHKHKRIPEKIKYKYVDPSEYLVTLIEKNISIVLGRLPIFFENPGKAVFIIFLENIIIMNAHLPIMTDKMSPSKEFIDKVFDKFIATHFNNNAVILCGDFNRKTKDFYLELHKKFSNTDYNLSCIVDSDSLLLKTLPSKKKSVDQIIGFNNVYFDNVHVMGSHNLSDHNILFADVSINSGSSDLIINCKKILETIDISIEYFTTSVKLYFGKANTVLGHFISINKNQLVQLKGLLLKAFDEIDKKENDAINIDLSKTVNRKAKVKVDSDLHKLKIKFQNICVEKFGSDTKFKMQEQTNAIMHLEGENKLIITTTKISKNELLNYIIFEKRT
jgi:hypothetical protein